MTYQCKGVVIVDGKCHLFSDPRTITHDGSSSTQLKGHTVYTIPNPP